MPLRLIEIVLPSASLAAVDLLPSGDSVVGRWDSALDDERVLIRMLVKSENTEALLDDLASRFSNTQQFRVILLPVEATLPRLVEPAPSSDAPQPPKSADRISREELVDDVAQGAKLSRVFIVQTLLATIVAAVGLIRNDTAIIIGAMVIAPLLGPNVSLCLATTLGDLELAKRSVRTNAVGLSVTLAASLLIGALFSVDPSQPALTARIGVHGGDIVLALASGCAGVLAFTTGAPTALIGVMVAVALLPPFCVFGLLLASGHWQAASGALMLVATNVICVNLAGVLTFSVQGIRPRTWWEARRARLATRIVAGIWAALLAILIGLVYLSLRYSTK